jgi:hypothetical protein
LLEEIRKKVVGPRLRQELREAIRVDLGLTEMPAAVSAKLREYAVVESGRLEERPISGSIDEIFERADRQLLILGEPGTGKTNLLMELAQHLISEANRNQSAPIPVVFSLPSWTLQRDTLLRFRSLSKWMQDDLTRLYKISPATAKVLVEHDLILPLLDGLDEVAEDRRADCVREIGAYQKERNIGALVVCSRIAKFEELPKLDLGVAVRVEKLSRQDVEREIAKPGLEYVKRALDRDPELWSLVDTPLWLHVLYGAAMVDVGSSEEANPRDRLYARYVKHVISRAAPDSPRLRTKEDLLLRWLGSLAVWMQRANQVDLVVADLDFLLLVSRQGVWVGGLIPWLTAGLVAGAIGGREVGFAVGLGVMVASMISQLLWNFFARSVMSGRLAKVGLLINMTSSVIGYGLLATLVGAWFYGSGLIMGFRVGLVALICSGVSGVL